MKKVTLAMMAATLIFTACKKEKETDPIPLPPSPVEGYWKGIITTTGQLGFEKYAMLIKPDGYGRVYDIGNALDTTTLLPSKRHNLSWTLTGSLFETSYFRGVKMINTKTIVNAEFTAQEGTWKENSVLKGSITLER